MKKVMMIVLALAMVLALAACGGGEGSGTQAPATQAPATQAPATQEPATQEPADPATQEPAEPAETPDEGGNNGDAAGLPGYPADLNEWTPEDFQKYLTEEGVFTNESFIMPMPAEYWPGMAIRDGITYIDDTGMISVSIYTIEPDQDDFMAFMRENHTFDETLYLQPVDHLVGRVCFMFEKTLDEDVYNAMDAAYNKLIEAYGITPDF